MAILDRIEVRPGPGYRPDASDRAELELVPRWQAFLAGPQRYLTDPEPADA